MSNLRIAAAARGHVLRGMWQLDFGDSADEATPGPARPRYHHHSTAATLDGDLGFCPGAGADAGGEYAADFGPTGHVLTGHVLTGPGPTGPGSPD